MKKVYSADNLAMSGYVKSMREENQINCVIKNQNLVGAMGELPPIECWPEVWVLDDDEYENAMQIINTFLSERAHPREEWICRCGEKIEGQFSACWSCGRERAD